MNTATDADSTHIEPDAVLEELWAIRERIMRESDYDIDRMAEAMCARTAHLEREGFTFLRKPLPHDLCEKARDIFRKSHANETAPRLEIIYAPTHRA
jgi:hypothetical protein